MEGLALLGSALSLGLLGGFHCLGMCGPLALAIPGESPSRAYAYHSGRIFTYVLLGLIAGVLGDVIRFAGWQQWLSVMSGILILILVWLPRKLLSPVSSQALSLIHKLPQEKNMGVMIMAGMANGLLPCGLVYIAMAGSVSAHSAAGSMLYMAVFGVGTLPLLLILSFAGKLMPFSARNLLRKSIPWLASFIACLLILRGMNLGIPYLSPKQTDSGVAKCCQVKDV